MNKRLATATLVIAAVLLAGGVGAGVILGQSGGDRPERYVDPLFTPTPVTADPCAPPDVIEEFCTFLITPEPQPSPVVVRTDIPPIPFTEGLRDDCPQGWDSTGQTGVFSICYPADEWVMDARIDQEASTELSWRSFVGLTSQEDPPEGLAVRFFPAGIPSDPNPCEDPFANRLSPTTSEDVAGYQGLSCVLDEGHGPPLRLYIFTHHVASGTLVAQTYVLEPDTGVPGDLPDGVLHLLETLEVQP